MQLYQCTYFNMISLFVDKSNIENNNVYFKLKNPGGRNL